MYRFDVSAASMADRAWRHAPAAVETLDDAAVAADQDLVESRSAREARKR